jgi:hypothetical protein
VEAAVRTAPAKLPRSAHSRPAAAERVSRVRHGLNVGFHRRRMTSSQLGRRSGVRPPHRSRNPKPQVDHSIHNPLQPCLKLGGRGDQVDGFEAHSVALNGHGLIHCAARLGVEQEALGCQTIGGVRAFLAAQVGVELVEISAFQDLVTVGGRGQDRGEFGVDDNSPPRGKVG